MAQTIKIKRSSTSGNKLTSSNSVAGELGLNTADKALYIQTGSSNGDVVTIAHESTLKIDEVNGRIGIGTTSPGTTLDVNGDIRAVQAIYSEGSSPRVQLQDTDGTNQFSFFQQSTSQLSLRLRNDTSDGSFLIAGYGGTTTTNRMLIGSTGDLTYYRDDGSTTALFLDASNGNFGIGTNSPDEALVVSGDGARIYVNSADYNVAMIGRRGSSGVSLDQGYIRLKDQGTNKVVLDSAGPSYFNGGNVGINTTSPDTKLDIDGLVNGGIAFTATQVEIDRQSVLPNGRIFYNDSRLIYDSPANGHRFAVAGNQGSNLALEIYSNRDIGFYNSSAAVDLFWDASTSQLGIGTTSPGRKLTVQGGSGDNLPVRIIGGSGTSHGSLEFQDPNTTADYKVTIGSKADDFYIQAGGGEKVRILANGNVGIGTTNPVYTLVVSEDGNDNIEIGAGIIQRYNRSSNAYQAMNYNAYSHNFYTTGGGQQSLFIKNDGNVGIGTASPYSGTNVKSLTVNATSYPSLALQIGGNNAGLLMSNSSGTDLYALGNTRLQFKTNDTTRIKIAGTGEVTFNEEYTFPTSDGSANQVLKTDGSGNLSFVTIAGAGAITEIEDADGDTKIQVEESADEDKIRFDIAGTEKVILDSSNFSIESGGFRVDDPGGNYPFRVTQYGYMTSRGVSATQLNATGDHANVPLSVLADVNSTRTASYVEIGDIGSAGNRFKIDNSGRVGINQTNPSHKLQVSVDANGAFIERDIGSNAANLSEFNSHRSLLILNRNAGSYLAFGGNSSRTDIQATDLAGTPTAKNISLNPFGGSVSVGVTSPGGVFDVDGTYGDFTVGNPSVGSRLTYYDTTRITLDSNNINFYTNSLTERMRIDSSGRVGIGTTSPGSTLDVQGNTNLGSDYIGNQYTTTLSGFSVSDGNNFYGSYGTLLLNSNQNYTSSSRPYMITNALGANKFAIISGTDATTDPTIGTAGNITSGSARLVIDNAGNVGIGTNAPARPFHVVAGTGTVPTVSGIGLIALVQNNSATDSSSGVGILSGNAANGSIFFGDAEDADIGKIVYEHNNNALAITTNATERMRIDSSGNVGIGTTSPQSFCRLDVRSTGASGAAGIAAYGYASNGTAILGNGYAGSAAGTNYGIRGLSTGPRGSVSGSVNVGGHFEANGAVSNYALTTGAGNVGIGTTSPDAKFEVEWTGTNVSTDSISRITAPIYPSLEFYSTNTNTNNRNWKIASVYNSYGTLEFLRSSAANGVPNITTLAMNNAGNVGIGTASPAVELDIKRHTNAYPLRIGSSQGEGRAIAFADVNASPTKYNWIAGTQYNINNGFEITPSTAVGGYTFSNPALAILQDGNVGIGISSPVAKLNVVSSGTIGWSNLANAWVLAGTINYGIGFDNNELACKGTDLYFGTITANTDVIIRAGGTTQRMLIDGSNGNISIGTNTSPQAKLQVEELGIDTTTTSTTATTQVAIDTMAAATFRSAKYTIQVTNSTDSTYHITEILLIHDGTTPGITEYGTVFTGSAAEATFDADISSGNVRLLATPASTDSMTFKVVRHCITV